MKHVLFGSVGRRIKVLRNDLGLSATRVCELLKEQGVGVSHSTLARFERDETSPPGDVLAGLARVLGTSADYLVLLTDDPAPRMGVSDVRVLSMLEEATAAYEVDRDVERLLQMWAQLSEEDRRFLLRLAERLYAARPKIVE